MSQTQTPSLSATRSINSSCFDVNGNVICWHDLPAARRTSRTDSNPGRDFYCCTKDRDDSDRCKFFKWVDELNLPGSNPQPLLSQSPQKRPLDPESAEPPISTPKRPRVIPSQSSTPHSVNRTDAIRQALTPRSSQQDENPFLTSPTSAARKDAIHQALIPRSSQQDENPFLTSPVPSQPAATSAAVIITSDNDSDDEDSISADTLSTTISSLQRVRSYVQRLENMNAKKDIKITKLQRKIIDLEREIQTLRSRRRAG
ncbi:topoisomerase iii alpha [Moniliophthora roreri MCA 2997]|uniref:Topoisomerase iii alpha n=1 Tax=Moniliophthora roreri (strain MCA 2997) TaxID=1381753 RepID=V2XS26_MONRO|nr:topoisomerase iii alpha [Moniliophthora roreri MCA 2997]